MKKLFFFLIIPVFSMAQNLSYVEYLNSLTFQQTKEVSDEIVSNFRVPMKYYGKITNSEKNEVYIYYPNDTPEDVIKEDMIDNYCTLCTEVEFTKIFKNANIDLEIPGTLFYSLHYVSAKYLDLFPWWEKHFATGSNKEDLLEKEYSKRYVEDRAKRINIRFVKNQDVWEIKNFY